MSTGLYSGVSGLALGTGLYKGAQGLWGGSSGLIDQFGATLSLNFLAGEPLDSRITFSRTTNATLVDSTGRVTYAPNNLQLRSEEFDNALWVKAGVTVTANTATAPNGTTTADKVIPSAVTSSFKELQQNIVVTVGVNYTFSYYVKADGYSFVQFVGSSGQFGTFSVNYDLSTGTETAFVTGTSTITQRSITDAGSGWYRISVTATALATGSGRVAVDIIPASNSLRAVSWAGDGTSGVLMWGAQAEAVTYQTTPGTYNQTVASVYYGPRFDYDPVTLAPRGLLIEEQRVNLLLYSEQFDNAGWTKSSASVTANATTSPDGTANADRLTADGVLAAHVAQQIVTYTAAAHTLSVYAKRDTNNFVQVRFGVAASAQGFVNFDLNAGTVGTIGATVSSASITPAGNGWYRCVITATTAAVGSNAGFYIVASATSGSAESNTLTTSVFLYGAQLELGAFATSYIPTVASTVTRATDSATMTGTNFSSWYNASEGTVVVSADSSRGGTPASARTFQFDDNTADNNIRAAGQSTLQVVDATVTQATIAGTPLIPFDGTVFKFASAYKLNDFATVTTGAVTTDTSGTVPAINQLQLGRSIATGNTLNGHIRTFTFYPQRLANEQLQALSA